MTKNQALTLSGRDLLFRIMRAARDGKVTMEQVGLLSEAWLRSHGYVQTMLGWRKLGEFEQMGGFNSQERELVTKR